MVDKSENKKRKYEPPRVYELEVDMAQAMGQSVCDPSGSKAGGQCTSGNRANSRCESGNRAAGACGNGSRGAQVMCNTGPGGQSM